MKELSRNCEVGETLQPVHLEVAAVGSSWYRFSGIQSSGVQRYTFYRRGEVLSASYDCFQSNVTDFVLCKLPLSISE